METALKDPPEAPAPGPPTPAAADGSGLSLKSAAGRWVIAATVLGAGVAMIDGTVVNIALPAIGRDFGTGLAALQWTVTAYTLTLAALILLGGALGDRYGRRRIFVIGIVWFAVASLLCGLAPTVEVLVLARALQGIGGALLTPGSLAIIQATFREEDRAAAIGLWSGLSGVALAIGPFVGGYLIQAVSWRLIFLINVPLVIAVVWIAVRHVPETKDEAAQGSLDISAAALASLGLGALIYGLIAGPEAGWASAQVVAALAGGVVTLALFLVLERRRAHPMLPLGIFRSRQFSGANATTFVMYGALGGALFLIPIQLQQVLGYSPIEAGLALLPVTLMLLALSAWAGRLSQRIGPKLPMTLGPITAGVGLALLGGVGAGDPYATVFFPAVMVFSFGLALTVAPLTAAVLAAAPIEKAGLASAVNNAVARAAGLIAVAALPAAAGLTGASYLDPPAFSAGYTTGMLLAGGLCVLGGLIALATVPGRALPRLRRLRPAYSCPLDAPPLRDSCESGSCA
jgi:EmrB/QacA subfamily drug resistance transporter